MKSNNSCESDPVSHETSNCLGQDGDHKDKATRVVRSPTMSDVKYLETVSEELDYVKTVAAPKSMQDGSASVVEPLDVVDLSTDPSVQKQVSISSQLSLEVRENLVTLLKEYKDVFAWKYEDMPGLNPEMVCHALNVSPGSKPIKQPRRNFHPEVEARIKDEIEKLLAAGFIKPI